MILGMFVMLALLIAGFAHAQELSDEEQIELAFDMLNQIEREISGKTGVAAFYETTGGKVVTWGGLIAVIFLAWFLLRKKPPAELRNAELDLEAAEKDVSKAKSLIKDIGVFETQKKNLIAHNVLLVEKFFIAAGKDKTPDEAKEHATQYYVNHYVLKLNAKKFDLENLMLKRFEGDPDKCIKWTKDFEPDLNKVEPGMAEDLRVLFKAAKKKNQKITRDVLVKLIMEQHNTVEDIKNRIEEIIGRIENINNNHIHKDIEKEVRLSDEANKRLRAVGIEIEKFIIEYVNEKKVSGAATEIGKPIVGQQMDTLRANKEEYTHGLAEHINSKNKLKTEARRVLVELKTSIARVVELNRVVLAFGEAIEFQNKVLEHERKKLKATSSFTNDDSDYRKIADAKHNSVAHERELLIELANDDSVLDRHLKHLGEGIKGIETDIQKEVDELRNTTKKLRTDADWNKFLKTLKPATISGKAKEEVISLLIHNRKLRFFMKGGEFKGLDGWIEGFTGGREGQVNFECLAPGTTNLKQGKSYVMWFKEFLKYAYVQHFRKNYTGPEIK